MGRGPRTASNGQIQKREQKGKELPGLDAVLVRRRQLFTEALPRHVDPDRMMRVLRTAVRTVPKLAECEPVSVLSCMAQCAMLGIEPNTPLHHAALIPRKRRVKQGSRWVNDGMECTLIIEYQGFIELAYRSGKVRSIQAYAVREGDHFEVRYGTDPGIDHKPSSDPQRDERPISHVYACALLDTGEWTFTPPLSRTAVLARKARSSNVQSAARYNKKTPWDTDEEAMFRKTAIRELWKYIPKSAEMSGAASVDTASTIETGRVIDAVDPEALNIASAAAESQGYELPPATESTPEAEFVDEPGPEVRLPGDDSERQPGED